jgi:hypothetical protein
LTQQGSEQGQIPHADHGYSMRLTQDAGQDNIP